MDTLATLPSIICNSTQLSRYVDFTRYNVSHLNVTAEEVSEKLCNISTKSLLDLTQAILEELDIETFIHVVS